jgi:hypothetical protein
MRALMRPEVSDPKIARQAGFAALHRMNAPFADMRYRGCRRVFTVA